MLFVCQLHTGGAAVLVLVLAGAGFHLHDQVFAPPPAHTLPPPTVTAVPPTPTLLPTEIAAPTAAPTESVQPAVLEQSFPACGAGVISALPPRFSCDKSVCTQKVSNTILASRRMLPINHQRLVISAKRPQDSTVKDGSSPRVRTSPRSAFRSAARHPRRRRRTLLLSAAPAPSSMLPINAVRLLLRQTRAVIFTRLA